MKQISKFGYAMIAIAMIVFCGFTANAETFEVDGVYYTTSRKNVSAVAKPDGTKYSGSIVIPQKVVYNNTTYNVISMEDTIFKNSHELTSVEIQPVKVISLANECFVGCTALETVVLHNKLTTIGSFAFNGCTSLKNIDLSNVKDIKVRAFWGCTSLESVTLLSAKTISENAFGNTGLKELTIGSDFAIKNQNGGDATSSSYVPVFNNGLENVTFNEGVTAIPVGAFKNCTSLKPITTFPSTLVSIGDNAFPSWKLADLYIPKSLNSIGSGNLSTTSLKSITIAEGNEYFTVKNNALYSKDEKTLHCVIGASYAEPTEFNDDVVEVIKALAFADCAITKCNTPNIKKIEDRAFCRTLLTDVIVKKGVQYGVVVYGGCSQLTSVTIEEGVTALTAGIFSDCPLKSISLSSSIEDIKSSSLPSEIESINCDAMFPPVLDGTPKFANATLTVPASSVALYKAHQYWSAMKEIKGNESLVGYTERTELPVGVYFAERNGNIKYYQGGNVYDTGVYSGYHAFNMQAYDNALYVSDAGEKYLYHSDGNNTGTGDGSIYKVEKMGDKFVKVKMITSPISYRDPYTLWIDNNTGDLLSCSRNTGIYKFNINDKNWYIEKIATDTIPSLVSNWNTLPYYGRGITYGAFGRSVQKDSNGVYWAYLGYNANGIYRFTENDIYPTSAEAAVAPLPYSILMPIAKISSTYLDEANGYYYAYVLEKGLYRIALNDIENANDDMSNWELLDSSVAEVGSTTDEPESVRQIISDGKYIYWSLIAPEGAEYKSGIKYVNASGTPEVKYLVEGVEAYGLAPYKVDLSGVENVEQNNNLVNISDNTIGALADVKIEVYGMNGTVCKFADLCAGQQISLDLAHGIYVVKATGNNGETEIAKVVVK